jgi:RND family efflux transporter MFP subunit
MPHNPMTESNTTFVETPALPAGNSRPKSRGPKLTSVIGILACVGLALAVYLGIHSRGVAEAGLKHDTLESLAAPVEVIHPQLLSVVDEITLPGSAQAFSDTPIYARTSGYLRVWNVDIGSRVKRDQVLAEIETPEVDQQLEQAQADLKNAQANLALAEITATRWEELFKKNTVSSQERDQADSDLMAKKALVNSSEANVRRLTKLQSFEKVVAPFDGVITSRNIDLGALIQAGDNSSAKELFHLVAIQTLRVYVSVPEVYAGAVKTGDEVKVTFDSLPGEEFAGTLVRNAGAIDPRSRTLNVEADVENPKGLLFSGGYATVRFKLPPTVGCVNIPSNTLLFRAEGLRVAVVRNDHVVMVPIRIGHDHGASVDVISGLTPKDAVVLDPSDSLGDGAPVRIEDPSKIP